MKIEFSLISEKSYVKNFDCGNLEMNLFLQKFALFNQENRLATTTVICDLDKIEFSNDVLGFYTLCPSHIPLKNLPPAYKKKPFPDPITSFKLARLAVDKSVQGQGVGKVLLAHALKKCVRLSSEIESYIVLIDVKEQAKTFYTQYFGTSKIVETSPTLIGIRIKDIEKYL